jgi:tetratricopeptide (TPR) repeat protein
MEALYKQVATGDNVIAKVSGASGQMSLNMMRGRMIEAARLLKEAKKLTVALGQPESPLGDSLQASWIDLYYYDDTTRAVRRVEQALASKNIRSMPFPSRPYFGFASFFALTGQPQRARALLAQYDADVPDSNTRRIREPGRHSVLGAIALGEGRPLDAVREFWRADTTYDGPDGSCAICVLDEVGGAWRAAGVPDSAIFYWEKYLNTPYYGREGMDAFQAALMHKWLGELYESKGDAANAAKHYREFVLRWDHADPDLQPKVAEVRRRLSRMADVERK